MGSDVTAKAVKHQVPRLKAIGRLQLDALESGDDPKDVDLSSMVKGNKGQKLDTSFISPSTISLPSFISIILAVFETPY